MGSNVVVINDKIKFKMDDIYMGTMFSLLNKSGTLVLNCPWCGLTVIPQSNSAFVKDGKKEQRVKCVGCGKMVTVRMYSEYGFVLDEV